MLLVFADDVPMSWTAFLFSIFADFAFWDGTFGGFTKLAIHEQKGAQNLLQKWKVYLPKVGMPFKENLLTFGQVLVGNLCNT